MNALLAGLFDLAGSSSLGKSIASFEPSCELLFSPFNACEPEAPVFICRIGTLKVPLAGTELRKVTVACRGDISVSQEEVHFYLFVPCPLAVDPVIVHRFAESGLRMTLCEFAVNGEEV